MAADDAPGEEWWHWLEEFGQASNFSFLDISCVNARTPAFNSTFFSQNKMVDATRVVVEAL